MSSYQDFLASKAVKASPKGLDQWPALNSVLKPFQKSTVEFCLKTGRAAAFLDTGLGKSFIALEWGRVISEVHDERPVLMLAPLAVSQQHAREAEKFGIAARVVSEQSEVGPGINITNYEKLDKFDPSVFIGVILDESSILKSFTGVTTRALIAAFEDTPFKLACTATPAPNDHMELGTHSEFLGHMDRETMLSRWFLHDSANTKNWRLKGHAAPSFWSWVASWARCAAKPSDLGDCDDGYILPDLVTTKHEVQADRSVDSGELLFRIPDTSATSIHKEKRLTAEKRAEMIAEIVNAEPDEPWMIWCDTDYEADALTEILTEALEVRGSMKPEEKEARLVAFSEGDVRVLVSKPSICGFGLNWQHCARIAFMGLSFSYENYYQAIRRCWRFGQARPVEVHICMADTEREIWNAVSRKESDHQRMKNEMAKAMKRAFEQRERKEIYTPVKTAELPQWIGD